MRTIGVTEGESEPDLAIWPRLSMYCRLSRSARMSHGLCSISYTMPSYFAVDIAIAVSGSAWQNDVNAGLPASSARITPFRRGLSAMLVPYARGPARILTDPNAGMRMVKGVSSNSAVTGGVFRSRVHEHAPTLTKTRRCHDQLLPRPLHDRAERPAAMAQGADRARQGAGKAAFQGVAEGLR